MSPTRWVDPDRLVIRTRFFLPILITTRFAVVRQAGTLRSGVAGRLLPYGQAVTDVVRVALRAVRFITTARALPGTDLPLPATRTLTTLPAPTWRRGAPMPRVVSSTRVAALGWKRRPPMTSRGAHQPTTSTTTWVVASRPETLKVPLSSLATAR